MLALATSPTIRAAAARAQAAQARVAPAGARPDPMLMAGVQNVPVSEPGFSDFMTMKMVGVEQTIPYPGKLSLRTRAAEAELAAAQAELQAARLSVAREVREAYYELAFLEQAFRNAERNQTVLANLIPAAEAHYTTATGTQRDVLALRVEAARVAEDAAALAEARRAALARLNAVLDRPSETAVGAPRIPEHLVRAAAPDTARRSSFVSAALGARAAGSPLPPLDSLQALAVRQNPMLRAHEARIAAQEARLGLAGREYLPDIGVSLSYGQRDGLSDMVTATVSVPIQLQKGRKQDALIAEARAELAALHAEHRAEANRLRAEAARLVSALERDRAQLALYVRSILPQGRAAVASATAGYQVGRTDLTTLLESQTTLFDYETQYFRTLADFATSLAELEQTVGAEVIR